MPNLLLQSIVAAAGATKDEAGKSWKDSTEIDWYLGDGFNGSATADIVTAFYDGRSLSAYYGKYIYITRQGVAYASNDGTLHNLTKLGTGYSTNIRWFESSADNGYIGYTGFGEGFRFIISNDIGYGGSYFTTYSTNTVKDKLVSQFGSWPTNTINPGIDYIVNCVASTDYYSSIFVFPRGNQSDTEIRSLISIPNYSSGQGITLNDFVVPIGLRGSAALGSLLFDYTTRWNYNIKKIIKASDGTNTYHFIAFDNGYITKVTNVDPWNWTASSFTNGTPSPKRGHGRVRYVEGLNKFVSWDKYAVNPVITSTHLTSWSPIATPQTYTANASDRLSMNYGSTQLQAVASNATGTNIVIFVSGDTGRYLVSSNGGSTWTGKTRVINQYDDYAGPMYCMFTGSNKFIAVYKRSIALSTDNGSTFSDVVTMGEVASNSYYHTNLLAYSGNQTGSPGTILVMRTSGPTTSTTYNPNEALKYYRSTDGGSTWTAYTTPWSTGVLCLCWDPGFGAFICVPSSSANEPTTSTPYRRWFYVSSDGITWNRTSLTTPGYAGTAEGYTTPYYPFSMIVASYGSTNTYYLITTNQAESSVYPNTSVLIYSATSLANLSTASYIPGELNLYNSDISRHDFSASSLYLSIGGSWGQNENSNGITGHAYIDHVYAPTTIRRYSTRASTVSGSDGVREYLTSYAINDMSVDGANVLVVGGTLYSYNGSYLSDAVDPPGIYRIPMAMDGSSTYGYQVGAGSWSQRYTSNDTYSTIQRNPADTSGSTKYLTKIGTYSSALYTWSGVASAAPIASSFTWGSRIGSGSGGYSGSNNIGTIYKGFVTHQNSQTNYFQKDFIGGHTPYYNFQSSYSDFAEMSGHAIDSVASNGKGVVVYKTFLGPSSGAVNANVQFMCLAYPNVTSANKIRVASRNELTHTYYNGNNNYDSAYQAKYRRIPVVWTGKQFYTLVGQGTSNATKRIATSTDGINWTYNFLGDFNLNSLAIASTKRISHFIYTGGVPSRAYLLFFEDTNTVYFASDSTGVDGRYFDSQSTPTNMRNVTAHAFRPNEDGFNTVSGGFRRLVVSATENGYYTSRGRFFYSDDYKTWTECTMAVGSPAYSDTEIVDIIWSHIFSKFIALERGGYESNYASYLWESVDGITWTRRATQTPQYRYDMVKLAEYINPKTMTGYIVCFSSYFYNTVYTSDLTNFTLLYAGGTEQYPGILKAYESTQYHSSYGSVRGFLGATYPLTNGGGSYSTPNKYHKAYGKALGGFTIVSNTGKVPTELVDTNFTGEYGSASTLPLSSDILVVGGGGGGGAAYDSSQKTNYVGCGGGGGAGGYVTAQNFSLIKGQTYQVAVGSGGAGFTAGSAASPWGGAGGTSYFRISPTQSQLIAYGGLGGGNGEAYNSWPGQGSQNQTIGGSAGGSAGNNSTNAVVRADVHQQVINGGGRGGSTEYSNQFRAGGGGGAGGSGQSGGPISLPAPPGTTSGNGGAGLSWLDGNAYAGGGGGALNWGSLGFASSAIQAGGYGGSGVGGTGATPLWNGISVTWYAPTAGYANTGSGGGGAGGDNNGGNGAKGVVVLRIPTTYDGTYSISVDASLTYTNTTAAGYRYYRFTDGSGNITFN